MCRRRESRGRRCDLDLLDLLDLGLLDVNCDCTLQYKCHLVLELSTENAEKTPLKCVMFNRKMAFILQFRGEAVASACALNTMSCIFSGTGLPFQSFQVHWGTPHRHEAARRDLQPATRAARGRTGLLVSLPRSRRGPLIPMLIPIGMHSDRVMQCRHVDARPPCDPVA